MPGARNAAVSANGQRIAVQIRNLGVTVMDVDGTELAGLPGENPVISPDGSLIATVTPEHIDQSAATAMGGLHCILETTVLGYEDEGAFGEEPPGMIQDETCEPAELLLRWLDR